MDALITTGAIGSWLLITDSTIQMIKAGHAPGALLYFLILSIFCFDLWAIAPSQMGRWFPENVGIWLLWSLAILTYCGLLYRILHRRRQNRSAMEYGK